MEIKKINFFSLSVESLLNEAGFHNLSGKTVFFFNNLFFVIVFNLCTSKIYEVKIDKSINLYHG